MATTILGHICRAAETKTVMVKGIPTLVTTFSVAENYQAGGVQKTEYYRISKWREPGAKLAPYLKLGRPVLVEGRVQARPYKDAEGNAKAGLEIVNATITFASKNPDDPAEEIPADDESVPFEDEQA